MAAYTVDDGGKRALSTKKKVRESFEMCRFICIQSVFFM